MRKARLAVAAALWAAPLGLAAQTTPDPAPVPLTLSRAVGIATDTAPGVRLAELRAQETEARFRQARSELLPQVSAAATQLNRTFNRATFGIEFPSPPGTSTPDRVGPFNNFDARFSLRQTVFDAAGWVRTQAARQAVTAAEAERAVNAEAAAQRAGLAYLRAARAEATRQARAQDLTVADSLLSLARTQLQAGVSAAIDVTRAESQRVAAAGLLQVAANQAQAAQIELARALAVDPSTRFALGDALTATLAASDAPAGDAAGAVAKALDLRPDLRAELLRRRAAATNVRSIRAEALPRVDVIGDYGASGNTPGNAISTREFGVQVSVPLTDGQRRESRLAEQRLVLRESDVREGDLRQQIAADVNAALLELRSGQDQQTVAAERMRLAQQELSQARERFHEGVAGNIEVINAQSSLIRAEDAVIDARYATAVARVDLARAVGVAQTVR